MNSIGAIGPLLSTAASVTFLIIGAVAVYTMMATMGKHEVINPDRYRKLHRMAGWSFAALFVSIFVYMIIRLRNNTDEYTARITFHFTLAIALLCLIAIKVSIARYFPNLGKHLFSLGVGVYLLAFPMVLITAGYHAEKLITHKPYVYHSDFDSSFADERLGKEFLIMKCSTCHPLQSILKPRSKKAWGNIVSRMVLFAQPRISNGEANQILAYLAKNFIPKTTALPSNASLIEKHCLPCHAEKDVYRTPYNFIAWKVIIRKMSEYDENIVQPDKVEAIAEYLVKTQQSMNGVDLSK